MSAPVTPAVGSEAAFLAAPAPMVVLDTGLVIQNVNLAYARATLRDREELIGQYMFDAFPDNPHDPEGDGVAKLGASFHRVMDTRARDAMPVQKYDIPWKGSATGFTERYWSPVNSPVPDGDGGLLGIVHHVEDVTEVHLELDRVRRAYARSETPGAQVAESQRRFARYLAAADEERSHLERLEGEVTQLRQALASRAVIDQAIGIVQAERRCAPDDAFQVLVTLSQKTNAKLREVATALVRLAASDGGGPIVPGPV